MNKSNNNDYIWTFNDVRALDKRLGNLESKMDRVLSDLESRNHIVVDNTKNMDWKTVTAIVTAVIGTVGTLALAIWGAK